MVMAAARDLPPIAGAITQKVNGLLAVVNAPKLTVPVGRPKDKEHVKVGLISWFSVLHLTNPRCH
jgi:hypothetical protein